MFSVFSFVTVWTLLWVLVLAVCGFAYLRGGQAERGGAILIAGACLVTALVEGALLTLFDAVDQKSFLLVRLISGGGLALGFLILAVRFTHLWLGAAMILQASVFSLQAYYFVLDRPHDALYAASNNVAFTAILAALALGTWSARNRSKGPENEALNTTEQTA